MTQNYVMLVAYHRSVRLNLTVESLSSACLICLGVKQPHTRTPTPQIGLQVFKTSSLLD